MRKLIGIARMSPHMLPKVFVKPSPELPEPLINKFLLTHNPVTDGKRREKESGMLKATKQYRLPRIERYRRNAWGRFMMVVCTAANISMAAITGYWLYNAYQGIANHDPTIMKPLAALHGPVLGVGASESEYGYLGLHYLALEFLGLLAIWVCVAIITGLFAYMTRGEKEVIEDAGAILTNE